MSPCAAPAGEADGLVDLRTLAAAAFCGDRAHMARTLRIERGFEGGIACAELCTEAGLAPVLDAYCRGAFPGGDRRAAMSLWSQWYFGLLLPPLLVLAVEGDCRMPAAAADLRMTVSDSSRPDGFVLVREDAERGDRDEDPWSFHGALVEDHIAPLVRALTALSGLSPRVLWMNAAIVLDYAGVHMLDGAARSPAPLTAEPLGPDGRRNPLYRPYTERRTASGARYRRICCLRYMLDGVERCTNCPIEG